MSINQWPEDDRPREKLLSRGESVLTDAELIAIFLRVGVAGKSAVDMARDMLAHFGGLIPLLDADYQEFQPIKGMGKAKYANLKAGLELGRRYLRKRLSETDVLSSPEEARDYLMARLKGYRQEVFACLFLDSKHRVLDYEELFFGTVDGASVYPREVLKRALHHNAAAMILAHNHPSGVAEPSDADRRITTQLVETLAVVDVRVIDHVIVGDGVCYSFAERGLL